MGTKQELLKAGVVLTVFLVLAVTSYVIYLVSSQVVVSSYYATLEDARLDGLFERGWLPPILPESAIEIEIHNNLDINTSLGKFELSPIDVEQFVDGLDDLSARMAYTSEYTQKLRERGYVTFTNSQGLTWFFRCSVETGLCEYELPYQSRR